MQSVSWNNNDLLQSRFRLWKSLVSVSAPVSDPAIFSNKDFVKNFAFSISELPRKSTSHFFIVDFLFHFMMDPDPNPLQELDLVPEP
jgi:hypothetical protein